MNRQERSNQEEITEALEERRINKTMLRQVMDLVDEAAKVGLWNQGDWITVDESALSDAGSLDYQGQHYCKTAGCFAGWTVMMDGWKAVKTDEDAYGYTDILLVKGDERHGVDWVEQKAVEMLGLERWEADELFNGDNTLEDLHDVVDMLIKQANVDDEEAA